MATHRIDYGDFCVWQYNGPSKRARGFWHGETAIDSPMWAYALRRSVGDVPYWDTSRAKGGFVDQESAVAAARLAVGSHQ